VFVGDTLFAPERGTGRCDFPGADAATQYRSIKRLYAMPDATRVFLCHDYPPAGAEPTAQTTIGAEKASNTQLNERTSENDYVASRKARDATLPQPKLLQPSLQANIRAGRSR
jgi:glyoxylase-like metal-dependent hydrolase (beta-lactamase superfamily II)